MHNNNKTLIKKYFFSPLCCTSIFQLVIGLPARWMKSNQNAIKIIKFRMQKKKTKYQICNCTRIDRIQIGQMIFHVLWLFCIRPHSQIPPLAPSKITILCMCRMKQIRGHHVAHLDPLGINSNMSDEPIKFIHANYDFGK